MAPAAQSAPFFVVAPRGLLAIFTVIICTGGLGVDAESRLTPACKTVSGIEKVSLVKTTGLAASVRYKFVLPRGSEPKMSISMASGDSSPSLQYSANDSVLELQSHACVATTQAPVKAPGATAPSVTAPNGGEPSSSNNSEPSDTTTTENSVPSMSAEVISAASVLGALGRSSRAWSVIFASLFLVQTRMSLVEGAESTTATCAESALEIEVECPNNYPDFSSPVERADTAGKIHKAGIAEPEPVFTTVPVIEGLINEQMNFTLGGMEGYAINADNPRMYKNGGHRRPSDPATPREVWVVQRLLFGESHAVTLEEANALNNNNKGWGGLREAFELAAPEFGGAGFDVAQCRDASRIPRLDSDPHDANHQVREYGIEHGFAAANEWIASRDDLRRRLRNWNVRQITTAIPEKEHVIAVEDAIQRGDDDYELKRLIMVTMTGGYMDYDEKNKTTWGFEIHVIVDAFDITDPVVVPERLEVYAHHLGEPGPPRKRLTGRDAAYLKAAANAIYGKDRYFKLRYQANILNFDGNPEGANPKKIVKPYEWHSGVHAASVGEAETEHLFTASLVEYSPSTVPVDAHQLQAGVFMFPSPLTMVYSVHVNGTVSRPDPLNTLPGSEVVALCWYGRGLSFTDDEAAILSAAVVNSGNTDTLEVTNTEAGDLDAIANAVSSAIERAWGGDEATEGTGFYPGELGKRESDGVFVPKVALKHALDTPTYLNHETPKPLKQKGALMNGAEHRDVRDNIDRMAPLVDEDGKPVITPNGKPRVVVEPSGRSYSVDGYAVTYQAGLTWKFLLGWDSDAGLVIYHIRLVLPPTRAFPKGEEIPYLYRAFMPEFGTDYSTSSLGNPRSYSFFEDHFSVATDSLCPNGVSLPLFRQFNGAYRGLVSDLEAFTDDAVNDKYDLWDTGFPAFYSHWGAPPTLFGSEDQEPYSDPFSKELGRGIGIPMQGWPLDRQSDRNMLIPKAVCLSEMNHGHSMMHMYTNQQLRGLTVSLSSISQAYNIRQHYAFLSDGKMKVGVHAHGKPAVGAFGVPGLSGEFASGGRGGFAANHLHWHTVGLEPHLKGRNGILADRNVVEVSDLVPPSEDKTDVYGMGFYRKRTGITNPREQSELLNFDYNRNRWWRLAAKSVSGEDLGGLKISSTVFGPHVGFGLYDKTLEPSKTYAGTRWHLRQDVHIREASVRRNVSRLATARASEIGYKTGYNVEPPVEVPTSYKHPIMYAVLKLYHDVIEEELPVQNGFTNIEVNISPHNLLGYNPNILVRYNPEYNRMMENSLVSDAFEPPYKSEFGRV